MKFEYYQKNKTVNPEFDEDFKNAFGNLLKDQSIDPSFKSYLLDLPTANALSQEISMPDFDGIELVLKNMRKKIGENFQGWLLEAHMRLSKSSQFELTPKAFGERALKNQCLSYLVASDTLQGKEALENHYKNCHQHD